MNKKEKKVDEAKVVTPEEDNQKLEESLDVINLKDVEENAKPFNEAVEEKRKNSFVTYRKARTRNNIIMVAVVAVFIASMVLMVNENTKSWGTITGGCLIGATLVFLIVNYILTRNLFPNTTKNYIKFFMTTVDKHVFFGSIWE